MRYSKTVFCAAILLLLIVLISLLKFYIAIKPHRFIGTDTPKEYGMEYQNITLTTTDNIRIAAWNIPSKSKTNSTIIVAHGYPFDKSNILAATPFLHDNFNVFLFDFRYFGKSEGSYTTLGYREQEDLDAAIRYLKEKNQKIGVLGFSMGASTVIMSKNSDIKAVVADSPFASLGILEEDMYGLFSKPFELMTKIYAFLFFGIDIEESPLKAIREEKRPILLIHGAADSQISVRHSYLLANASKAELWIVKDADHGQAYDLEQGNYEQKVKAFFENHLD